MSEKSSFQDFRNNSLKPIGRWVSVYLNQYFRAFDFWHFSDSLKIKMIKMGKVVKLRKSGRSLIMTFPKSICDMFGLQEGSDVEITPYMTDAVIVKKVK